MTTILVTGATGNVGRTVVAELLARGVGVWAFVRDERRAHELLGPDVRLVAGDFTVTASLRRAMSDVDAVFLTSADGPAKVEHECAVIDAASAAWVPRIVKLSSLHVEAGSDLGFWDWHARIEEHLRGSGVPWVMLRANFLMSNLLAAANAVEATGQLFVPAGDAKIAMIDPRDVGASAAALLTGDGHEGRTYTVTGGEAITYADVAAQLSAATRRPVRFVDVPGDAAREALLSSGAPEWLADNLVRLFGKLRDGAGASVTDTVRELTGRAPRTFVEWARDHAAAFGG
ncbi:MAG: NAD(P)H-binding protein [Actinophytocola sp.]|nr:NAD(P)H-binding protein [Actinophytocola sp.]